MEEAWLSTPDPNGLTGWKSKYILNFLLQFGTDYDFLFSEHSASFVPNPRKYRHGMDWAIVTIQAGQLFLRFVRDRGDTEALVAHFNENEGWLPAAGVGLLVLLGGDLEVNPTPQRAVQLPPLPVVLREYFGEFEKLISPQRIEKTRIDLRRVQGMRLNGSLDIFELRPNSGFLANYAKVSDDIGRVPFWKPLSVYAGLIVLSPVLILAVLVGGPVLWFLKSRYRRPRPVK